jgi:dihydrofolate reductase
MTLTTMTQVSVDGVMQGNGGATEDDSRSGFERGGWAGPQVFGDDTAAFITQAYQHAGAFLFGRLTYEAFAGTWGAIADMRAHPIGVALEETPKYVASSTLTEPRWAGTTVLTLLIVPVVVGQGTRLFPGNGPDMALDLVDSRADSKGLTTQVYRPAGRSTQPPEAPGTG